jgi:N4-(beta-N-acetylglucosaminyl)-L-asparaginase
MSSRLIGREFLKVASGTLAGGAITQNWTRAQSAAPAVLPVVISSANGVKATARAMEILKGGGSPLDAVIAGVNIVEDDPNDNSVGYGGLPNEDCEVELKHGGRTIPLK